MENFLYAKFLINDLQIQEIKTFQSRGSFS